jgi:hypothetical protein
MNNVWNKVQCAVGTGVLTFFMGLFLIGFVSESQANGNVHVTRFWHNHQPVYWPEWMGDGGEPDRGQLAWDSIQKKPFQNYGGLSPRNNPENDLGNIFGLDDRRNAYQGGPSSSLGTFSGGGFAMSYSGALMDNVRQLGGGGHLGYGNNWNDGNTFRRQEGRLDLVGFTHHHSLGPLLPKEVFRKEIQIFKQAWWKAWSGNSDGSDHSRGFFPTEMAYSRDLIDVLVDEGYEWVIVASHHISRTSPSYNDRANPEGSFNIYSSPPNRADQVGPRIDNPSQWWYSEPNPGNAAWNVAPYAYQLHKVQYVNPDTGDIKEMIAVPSDDVLSYRFGYANEGIGKINDHISPHATDPNRPVIVMPSTDGDNAWGGGSSSWMEATPQFFNDSANAGYVKTMPGAFVDQFKQHAPVSHVEEGAWIFPESGYGSPYFLKWIEPPLVNPGIGATNRYPGTIADMETPGYSLKFFSYAPLMAGANWVITAEQILRDQGGEVRPWVVHAPYGVGGGEFGDRNDVELAWHIYLRGLDSGFNYYGGLGNDDEVKPSLATKRAVDRLRDFMSTRMHLDQTGPTALKPQRFPYNPGAYTFGWFNRIPGGDERFLKPMPSEFYIWTHVYDVSGVETVNLKIRRDKDGVRSLANTHNETYAGGSDVEDWITIPMTRRELPNTRTELNTAANNGEIDFFVYDPAFQPTTGIELADYYFARIDEMSLPGFRGNLFDYYVESIDTRGNVSRSEIQHVWVEDDGQGGPPPATVSFGTDPRDCAPLTVTYTANQGPLEGVSPVVMWSRFDTTGSFSSQTMSTASGVSTYTFATVPDNAPVLEVYFQNSDGSITDNRGGSNYSTSIRDCDAPQGPVWTQPSPAVAGQSVTVYYDPTGRNIAEASAINIHYGYNGGNWTTPPGEPMTQAGQYWTYTYVVPAAATNITAVFNDGSTWDNNGGNDFHLLVEAGGPVPVPSSVNFSEDPSDCDPLTVTYVANEGILSNSTPVTIRYRFAESGTFDTAAMTHEGGGTSTYTFDPVPDNAPVLEVYFTDASGSLIDNANGANYSTFIRDCDAPAGPVWTQPAEPVAGESVTIFYNPEGRGLPSTSDINVHYGYNNGNWTSAPGVPMTQQGAYWIYTFIIPSEATNLIMAFNHRGEEPWDNNAGDDFVFEVLGGVPPLTGFMILTPSEDIDVSNATASYILSGIADGVTGDIAWTNALTGASGTFPAVTPWTSPAVALDVGTNVITLSGVIPGTGETETIASDNAGNYGVDWSETSQGTGFGNWMFYTSSTEGDDNGRFLGNGMNLGDPSWGLYANGGNLSEAKRPLNANLAVGQTLSVRMKNGFLDSGAGAGVALQNSAGDNLWEFFFNGGDADYSMTGPDTGIGWTADGLDIVFTLTSATTFDVAITPIGGTTSNLSGSLEAIADQTVAMVRFWNYNAGEGEDFNVFFNDLEITAPGSGEPTPVSDTVTITRLAAVDDSNGDGVPDDFYLQYLPDADVSDPDLGNQKLPGGNDLTLKDSFLLGLDPSAPEQTFTFDALNFVNGQMVVDWGSGSSRSYIMQYTPGLSPANWQDSGSPISLGGEGRTSDTIEMDPPENVEGFYRIRLWP